jgi:uncharacterized ferritin-like protein (DUF455 family)
MNIIEACIGVLNTGQPAAKASLARQTATAWREGQFTLLPADSAILPLRPARPERPALCPPSAMARRRLGSLGGRIALLHALAHIEFNAIDLAFDMVARFAFALPGVDLIRNAFVSDWLNVGDDEARHFTMVSDRLIALGSAYGDLPAHDGLWESAERTAGDLAARLAIAPLVLEARGLDVTPGMVTRLADAGDQASADILQMIYEDEVGHVACGARWFGHVCAAGGLDPQSHFQALVRMNFAGRLKPPFNRAARTCAGLPKTWYEPLEGHQFETSRV